ncbi:MAG: PDZ domain-containing protein, partial [Lacibacter sp.]
LKNCTLTNLGGNAIFFNKYNRNCTVSGCLISNIGASAVCFVGDPNAVRSPSFEYHQFVPLAQIDQTPGPKTNNYPAECTLYNNLMFELGYVEKQSAGVQLSMCQSITVSHNTIDDVPRAGINVSEGTWGGHIIEYNDVFNTVKESGDHGSFNSWGRDRYWHPDKNVLDTIVENHYDLTMLDVVKPIIIRNNRFRCDHGWDIDLDDGSSNYIISNNLCLNGGIKLREGVNRVVENNIMINNTFHPHVWFTNSNDVFRHNIVTTDYQPIRIPVWGKETDYNVFPDSASLKAAQSRGTDKHSVYGDLFFVNPQKGDFRLKDGAIAFSVGFKNFAMDNFGVVSTKLKAMAKKVVLPNVLLQNGVEQQELSEFAGAKVKNLTTPGEQSATGMNAIRGVLVVEVKAGSVASKFLQVNDVILKYNSRQVNNLQDLKEAQIAVNSADTELVIFRNQKEVKIKMK